MILYPNYTLFRVELLAHPLHALLDAFVGNVTPFAEVWIFISWQSHEPFFHTV